MARNRSAKFETGKSLQYFYYVKMNELEQVSQVPVLYLKIFKIGVNFQKLLIIRSWYKLWQP